MSLLAFTPDGSMAGEAAGCTRTGPGGIAGKRHRALISIAPSRVASAMNCRETTTTFGPKRPQATLDLTAHMHGS
ncbi:MAG TPA: hypothetical protein P5305_11490, partial [Rubrivivax sp.]|nr:hypothetical protein [Rubrivivax sp.]HRY88502.1 hypothetical protein [Rubrivivax sp.]